MEVLYKNKFLVSIIIGFLIAIVFYNYNKINNKTLEYNENNTDNKNKDNSLYLFLLVFSIIFIILYYTEDNVDEVYAEIDIGEPPF
jgi:uncharacterized membrane protein|tara:strand:+ start:856 stop:1113 length:258 start_codon:yes stop_codon:yes gene_type:complete